MVRLLERVSQLRVAPVEDPAAAARLVIHAYDTLGLRLPLRLWDGTRLGPTDQVYEVVIREPAALRALVPFSDLRAGEAYVRGELDIEGDIVAALHAGAHLEGWTPPLPGALRALADLVRLPPPPRDGVARAHLSGAPHSKERDRQAVQFHYDVGNDFFRLFLDSDLVYSCAYFLDPQEDLAAAQRRKLELVCRKLALRPGEQLLDIGCGWGSLVIHAAREHGVRALGVTLSEAQAELAAKRVAEAGLSDRVEIRLQDYRDVDGTFDAIASVGMFEHVGPTHLPEYFATVRRLAGDRARFLNHGITTGSRQAATDYAARADTFVARHVFPDGGLVPAWEAVRHMEQAGFEIRDVEQLRPSYALTLRRWVANLEANREQAVALADERTYRTWRAYMAGSVVGFETGTLGVVQALGTVGWEPPPGRAWMIAG